MALNESLRCEVENFGGLPTFVGHRSGQAEAALTFRTGFVDETVPRRGLTHLIEHLAAGQLTPSDGVHAQVTTTTTTMFSVEGEDEHVLRWLEAIAGRLVELPVERVECERRVLHIEEQNEGFSGAQFQLLSHYGYQGPGVAACREFGLRRLDTAELKERVARDFNIANASLALSRPLKGFDGLTLPAGARQQVPTATPLFRTDGPAEAVSDGRQVVIGAPVADEVASVVLARILERRAWEQLRHKLALVYDLRCTIARVGLAECVLTITCDALPKDARDAAAALLEIVAGLAETSVDDETLSVGIADVQGRLVRASFLGIAGAAASALRLERPRLPEDWLAEAGRVTAAEIRQAAIDLQAQLLVGLPDGVTLGLPLLVRDDGQEAAGESLRRERGRASESELVVGDEGVSVLDGTTLSTVRFDRCAAAIREPHGALILLGTNGTEVRVDPLDAAQRAALLRSVEIALIVAEDDLVAPALQDPIPRTLVPQERTMRPSPWLLEQIRRDNTKNRT